ncbi:hypothetical protein Hdeb2414_s0017g00507311 [Helianthus debilis subsp. tardiflorus]
MILCFNFSFVGLSLCSTASSRCWSSQTYKLYSSEREREKRISMEDILIEGVTCCYNKLGEHPVFHRRVHLNILNFLILCCLISFMCQLFL